MEGKIVRNVVLTGGPCAGKTTALTQLMSEFTERGWGVITIPEAAADMISHGVSPWNLGQPAFENVLAKSQKFREELMRDVAMAHPADKVLVIHDRGLFDQAAYLDSHDFEEMLANVGETRESAMARYDCVVHMRTAAYGAEEHYTLENNMARTETPEQARRMCDATLDAWRSHPHLWVVENEAGFEEKVDHVVSVVCAEAGAPYASSRQRKFLVANPSADVLEAVGAGVACKVETAYAEPEFDVDGNEREVRMRALTGPFGGTVHTRTVKVDAGDGAERLVMEESADADAFARFCDGEVAASNVKTRIPFACGTAVGSIDVFDAADRFALVEMRDVDGYVRGLPPEFGASVDVTGERAFRNADMAFASPSLDEVVGYAVDPFAIESAFGAGYAGKAGEAGPGSMEGAAMEAEMDGISADGPREVEVKLLLDGIDVDALRAMDGVREMGIKQTYISCDMPGETRVREKTVDGVTAYILTNKQDAGDGGLTRIETERELTAEEAQEYLASPDPERSPVEKTRFTLSAGGHVAEVDVYADDPANPSAVVEFELDMSDPKDRWFASGGDRSLLLVPDGFPAMVVADVTRMPEFKNGSLAKGFPEDGLVGMYCRLEQAHRDDFQARIDMAAEALEPGLDGAGRESAGSEGLG